MKVGQSIWHSKRKEIPDAEIAEYEAPVEIKTRFNYITCMPMVARGGLQVLNYGENVSKYWTVIANARHFSGKIKEGDLMWVDGEKPIESVEELYGNGTSANALVKSVSQVRATISIVLVRNQNQEIK